MIRENRLSIIDGTTEKVSKVLNLDPFAGAVIKKVKRLSLIDGTMEEVEMAVLLPIKGEKANE